MDVCQLFKGQTVKLDSGPLFLLWDPMDGIFLFIIL